MLTFHALLYPAPEQPIATEQVTVRDQVWPTLVIPPTQLQRGWPQSWEATMSRLEGLPRLYSEPDGSFTWVTDEGQISGVLYDRDGKMCYAELFGNCSSAVLDQFLQACGAPLQAFVFQLPREGVIFTDEVFRRFAAEPS